MNETSSMNRVLIWKEVRQIVPLMLMLLGVGATLIVLWLGMVFTISYPPSPGQFLPLILPALFAAGVGAVQIGQEKELRTIQWLSSLPISPRRLILTKFGVALGGLAVMWICCFVLIGLIKASGFSDRGIVPGLGYVDGNDVIYFPLHSVFILSCGMLTAWTLRNTFASLLVIVPLAFIPTLFAAGIELWMRWQSSYLLDEQRMQITTFVTVVIAIVFSWLTYRVAGRSFEPAQPPTLQCPALDWIEAWKPPKHTSALTQPFRYPISSLIWQSIHHNRLALGGIMILIMMGSICFGLASFQPFVDKFGSTTIAVGTLAGLLGVSWLGVFVFTGDGSERGLRFLADRGASPAKVWLGRHLIGISLLSIGILVYACVSLSLINRSGNIVGAVPSVGVISLLSILIYGVSQWTSQLTRILSAAALLAPLLSTVFIYWIGFSVALLGAPLGVMILCGGLPLLTTWLLMRCFMDSQRGISFYLWSLSWVVLTVFLPMMVFAIFVATSPNMSATTRSRLTKEANALPRNVGLIWQPVVISDPVPQSDSDLMITGEEAIAAKEKYWVDPHDRFNLNELSDKTQHPIHVSEDFIKYVIQSATYSILALRQAPDDEAATKSAHRWVVDLTRIGKGLRLSDRWVDQAAADAVEIWLTQALLSEPLASQLDREFVQRAVALISDREGRSLARRRAVLLSWSMPDDSSYDRFSFPTSTWGGQLTPVERSWIGAGLVDAFVDASLRMIEEGRQGRSTLALRRELHKIVFDSSLDFDDGPYSDRRQVDAESSAVFELDQLFDFPAMLWYAPWEADAAQLGQRKMK